MTTNTMPKKESESVLTEKQIIEWLKNNPDFL